MRKYTKIERQLLLYEIIFTSKMIEIDDVMRRLSVEKKTVQRDIKDLTDAGLIRLSYSRKEKCYKKKEPSHKISEEEGTFRYRHLKKLVRLTTFMEELSGAYIQDDLEYNCRKRYTELFPDSSERTRMRDYKTLQHIGYTIRWDEFEQGHRVTGYLHEIRETFE